MVKIHSIFVAFLENMNFNSQQTFAKDPDLLKGIGAFEKEKTYLGQLKKTFG